jgi:formylglycine-generating enzyme required for sulfatase activity
MDGTMLRVTLVLFLLLASSVAHAEKRVALVIGNSAYKHAGALPNPMNDAVDMAGILKQKGFLVIEGQDLDKSTFVSKVEEFRRAITRAEIAVFFYAGHGMQVAGQNFLVPTDAELATSAALDSELVPVSVVYSAMRNGPRFKIVVLDACRNNPLAEHLREGGGGASSTIGRGLAREDSLDWDSLASFSTQPGNTASDGDGRNSPFTTALIKHLALVDKNNDLGGILGRVRRDVVQATGRTQVPWDASSLRVPVYFDRSTQLELSEATLAWSKVSWQNYAQLEAFVNHYGDSPEVDRARKMLRIPACLGLRGGKPLTCIAVTGSAEKTSMTVAKSFRDCPQCPEMVIVPWGNFELGSPQGEVGRGQGEDQVRITIPFHFAVGHSMVSIKEWNACVDGGACRKKDNKGQEKLPVQVTLEEAKSYANWLSATTGKTYRLISEAEWERIIRAGTTTAYWWGSTLEARPTASANNPWDISSSGLEWVEDCWNDSTRGIPSDGRARTTGDCTRAVVRGSGDNQASTLRSAHRSPATHDGKGVGFRVVGSLVDR